MKILVVQDYLRSGGTERQSVLLAQLFHAAGHAVKLITFRPGGVLAGTVAPVVHRSLQPFDTHLDWWAPGWRRAVKSESPDIVLCMGRMANCWAGTIASTHERSPRVVATMRTGKPLPRWYRQSLQSVSHVVANSAAAREVLQREYGISADRITVIRNGLVFPASQIVNEREKARAETRRRFGARSDTVVMLAVGMFRPEKNQREMIDIAARLPREREWQLWFAGEGSERDACEAHARALSLAERVKFLGYWPNPAPLYAAADLAMLTSRSESLSNFLIEAHAHGLPSVAYAVSGVTECGGIAVPAGDPEAFLAQIEPLLTDERARKIESTRVAAYALEQFSPEKQARVYLDLFERLLNAPSA